MTRCFLIFQSKGDDKLIKFNFQRCIPEFENAAFMVQMEATNTCGDNGMKMFCIQTSAGTSTR